MAESNSVSSIEQKILLSKKTYLTAWGSYYSADALSKTEVSLLGDIIQGSILELQFATDGKFRYLISSPVSYSTSDTEYTDFILVDGMGARTARIYWYSKSKIKISTPVADTEHALRLITMYT